MPSPPTTRAGKPLRERIMLYGDADSGKTYNFLKVADWHQRRKSDATFYGFCTPGQDWEIFFAPGGAYEHLENVVTFDVEHIGEFYAVYDKQIKPQATAEDWLCVDVIGDAYDFAKDEYARREWRGMDLGAKWGTEGGEYPITGWEWGPINARYNGFAQNRLMRFPGHVMVLAWDRALKPDTKSGKKGEQDEIRLTFDHIGFKPEGQWDDFKRFRTLLHLARNPKGEHVIRTARDKERAILGEVIERGKTRTYVPHKLRDFFMEYLVRTAGWKL